MCRTHSSRSLGVGGGLRRWIVGQHVQETLITGTGPIDHASGAFAGLYVAGSSYLVKGLVLYTGEGELNDSGYIRDTLPQKMVLALI